MRPSAHAVTKTGWQFAVAMLSLAGSARSATAQRAPLVGTVAPGAVGAPATQPAPIGGLRTTPMTGSRPLGTGVGVNGWTGLRVIDAPIARGGVVVDEPQFAPSSPAWMPSYDKPTWTRDSVAEQSTMWRSLIVRDVVCNPLGRCVPRTSRVQARWIARCDCYAFADGWGRVWRVESRLTPASSRSTAHSSR